MKRLWRALASAVATCQCGADTAVSEVCPGSLTAPEVLPSAEAPAAVQLPSPAAPATVQLPSPEAPAAVQPDANLAPISTNQYYSKRTQWMIENRDKFSNRVEFEIECSKVHKTSVQRGKTSIHEGESSEGDEEEDGSELNEEMLQANRKTIIELRKPGVWAWRFQEARDGVYEKREKIGKGGQASIYAGIRTDVPAGARGRHVVFKVFEQGYDLRDLVKEWPVTSSRSYNGYYLDGWATSVEHVMLMPDDGRIAMVMRREWGDLRRLIDLKKQANNNQGPPFDIIKSVELMRHIASCMVRLHDTGVVHRDLKAANVLLRASKDNRIAWESNVTDIELPLHEELGDLPKVSDFECALSVVGTGFWRAPEVLVAVRDKCCSTTSFGKASDVYSYGMLCYEIATGFFPFEREGFKARKDEGRVIRGERPTFPSDVSCRVQNLISRCWAQDESARPNFREILTELRLM